MKFVLISVHLWWILELLERDERTKSRTLLTELRHTECAYYY